MKSLKFKKKPEVKKIQDIEFIKPKKKSESPTKAKVSLKSRKIWEDILDDDESLGYRIKGM
ncbi:MAG TPA: hypothetical protein PKD85_04220 [Saprospiraceae bacterium]|nr:hypothetical protein [Saprospiraceae bacterium]